MAFPSLRQPKSIKNMSRLAIDLMNKMEMLRIPTKNNVLDIWNPLQQDPDGF